MTDAQLLTTCLVDSLFPDTARAIKTVLSTELPCTYRTNKLAVASLHSMRGCGKMRENWPAAQSRF